jgi:hypothetical protein
LVDKGKLAAKMIVENTDFGMFSGRARFFLGDGVHELVSRAIGTHQTEN